MASGDEVVLDRLKLLDDYVAKLRQLSGSSFQEYQDNYVIRRASERLLHLAIEACLDIGHRLIAASGFRAPEDNKDVFVVLGEERIVPEDLLPRLVEMAAFRNLLVHGYARIDDGIVHGILRERLGDLEAYGRAIADDLTARGAGTME